MRVREGAERGCGVLGRARSNVHEEGRGCVGGVLSWERGGVQGVAAMCGRWEERRARAALPKAPFVGHVQFYVFGLVNAKPIL